MNQEKGNWMPGGSDMEQRIAEHDEMNRYIKSQLSGRDVLEALAEEAAELSQAALKMIRACRLGGMNNVTPVTPKEAADNLLEEMADVELVMDVLSYYTVCGKPIGDIKYKKRERWVSWLKELEEKRKAGK